MKFVFTILLFISRLCSAQSSSFLAEMDSIMTRNKVIGLNVLVVKHKKIIYSGSFGHTDMAGNPMPIDGLLRIASISKSFTATALMQQVEKGKVSLDDEVSTLIGFPVVNPKFPEVKITLRMLLSHRSSLNDAQGYFSLDSINPATSNNTAKAYNNYSPGTNYQYCNLNFNMAGAILERLTNQRFDKYIVQHILSPLHLTGGYEVASLNQNFLIPIFDYDKDSAKMVIQPGAYNPRTKELADYRLVYSTPVLSPTGGMKISAPDLARYMMMHMYLGKGKGKRIISKTSANLMQQGIGEEKYGLALMNTDKLITGIHLRGHTGSAYGLFSAMFFQPEEKYGFIVITNGCKTGYTDGYNNVLKKSINTLYKHFIQKN